jgi:hypothetical protein
LFIRGKVMGPHKKEPASSRKGTVASRNLATVRKAPAFRKIPVFRKPEALRKTPVFRNTPEGNRKTVDVRSVASP